MAPIKRKRVWNFSFEFSIEQDVYGVKKAVVDGVRRCAQRQRDSWSRQVQQEMKDTQQLYALGIWQMLRHVPPNSEKERVERLTLVNKSLVELLAIGKSFKCTLDKNARNGYWDTVQPETYAMNA